MPQQLPPGFEIRPYIDGPGLYLNGQIVGVASSIPEGRARVDLCVSTAKRHSHFLDSMSVAEEYLRRWAVRWEGRIREMHA